MWSTGAKIALPGFGACRTKWYSKRVSGQPIHAGRARAPGNGWACAPRGFRCASFFTLVAPLPSEEGNTERVFMTITWKPKSECGLDCLICAIFARQRLSLQWRGVRIWPPWGPRQVLGAYGRTYATTRHLRESQRLLKGKSTFTSGKVNVNFT